MALNFTTVGASSELSGVKMLVYGKAGRGKTMLCGTAPTPIILSAEAGLLSLARDPATATIPVITIKTVEDLTEAFNWCQSSNDAKQFQTICLDSISEIGEVVLANAKKQVKDPRQAYGELIEKMTHLIRCFRDLQGFHVYMSAKQEFNQDAVTGVNQYGPSMPGAKLSQQIPYFFDELFQLDIGKTPEGVEYRYLRTQPDFQYDAKDRSGSLDAIEQPNLTNIIQKILTK